MNAPSTMRLFVALHLPEPVQADLARAAAPLRVSLPTVRWVRADLLHLTLVFLGERPAVQVEAIAGVLDTVGQEQAPFSLHVGGNGCFPSVDRPRVLWTGLSGDVQSLIALRRAIANALAAAKVIEVDERFSPHLTIGRLRDGTSSAGRADAGRRWMNLPPLPAAFIPVEEIHLMHSVLTPGGPHYTTLRSIALARTV
jgi:2'-5' RNA ligase